MIVANKPFQKLTAEDLMSRDVTMLPRAMSLRTAAHLLSEMHVNGAPVINEMGVCVGVLSATDFMHSVGYGDNCLPKPIFNPGCFHSPWQVCEENEVIADKVGNYMTQEPVTTSPTTTVIDLARKMVENHIHRLIVVDDQQHPLGVVSIMDIMAAMANWGLPNS